MNGLVNILVFTYVCEGGGRGGLVIPLLLLTMYLSVIYNGHRELELIFTLVSRLHSKHCTGVICFRAELCALLASSNQMISNFADPLTSMEYTIFHVQTSTFLKIIFTIINLSTGKFLITSLRGVWKDHRYLIRWFLIAGCQRADIMKSSQFCR